MATLESYENKRENLWKLFDREVDGVIIKGKHLSYFKKVRGSNKTLDKDELSRKNEENNKFEIKCTVESVSRLLDHKFKYKRKWSERDIYLFGALQHYIDQCVSGGYKYCLISKTEYAMISR